IMLSCSRALCSVPGTTSAILSWKTSPISSAVAPVCAWMVTLTGIEIARAPRLRRSRHHPSDRGVDPRRAVVDADGEALADHRAEVLEDLGRRVHVQPAPESRLGAVAHRLHRVADVV